jgi:four helix bundle protein
MIYKIADLEVYKMSIELLKDLYIFLKSAPSSEFDLSKNCKRAAKSIPANIAEGFAKRTHEAVFKNHLLISLGSSDEVIAHLETLIAVIPRLNDKARILMSKYSILSKRLNTLHKNWHTYAF